MFVSNQQTLSKPIRCCGIGVHSGENVAICLRPGSVNSGIVFNKVSVNGDLLTSIKADYKLVSNTTLSTTISSVDGRHHISTIEHLMAALWGCGIDNIEIEVEGNELPILDGSAEGFVFAIESAGIETQNAPRNIIEILQNVEVKDGDAYAMIKPDKHFSLDVEIDFSNKNISKQKARFSTQNSSFKMDLCRARTFGFKEDVEKLKEMGLALGGSLDNAVVIDDDKILNKSGLRYVDEFVRHKILDAIGDLYLAGSMIKGNFIGFKSGHRLNNILLRKLFDNPGAWRLVSQNVTDNSPKLGLAV